MTPLETSLRQRLRALDAAALEALSSKGLMRRATKDRERGVAVHLDTARESELVLRVEDCTVVLPEAGPALARCSCPASGVCQHILVALLFLQEPLAEATGAPPEPPAADTALNEVRSLTAAELERWAGKPAVRMGVSLALRMPPEIAHGPTLRVRFISSSADVLFVPGGGLDGAIVSGVKGLTAHWVVAAVVALQVGLGVAWEAPEEPREAASDAGAPRSRVEVLAACETLLAETMDVGLARISPSNHQRWSTLAVSALGVHLPRLAASLKTIAEELWLSLARDARSDSKRLLERMAAAYALVSALQNAGDRERLDLTGVHRTRYETVGQLDLVGVSAWPWRTASGLEGLSVLFWEPRARQWSTWSESRPLHLKARFSPAGRFTQPGPWEGADSPRSLSTAAFRLFNARRNASRRLSSSAACRVLMTGPAAYAAIDLPIEEDWARLLERWLATRPTGLAEANPAEGFVVLRPAHWGARGFDPVQNRFQWILDDASGRSLLIQVPFDTVTRDVIQALESLQAADVEGACLVGRLLDDPATRCVVQPLSLLSPQGVMKHLGFPPKRATAPAPPGPALEPGQGDSTDSTTPEEDADDSEDSMQEVLPANSVVFRLLHEVEDLLLAVAEGGASSVPAVYRDPMEALTLRCRRFGLGTLAAALERWQQMPGAPCVLRCAYILYLHRHTAPALGPS